MGYGVGLRGYKFRITTMSEVESNSLTIRDYENALQPIAIHGEESYVRGITAIKHLSNNNERELLEATVTPASAHTNNMLSEQFAREQRIILEGTLIRFLCTSKHYSAIQSKNLFRHTVLEPIINWSAYTKEIGEEEAKKIMTIKKEVQQSISGVLWTFHKEELQKQGILDDYAFAKHLFPNEQEVIRPGSYNEGLIDDIRSELKKQQKEE